MRLRFPLSSFPVFLITAFVPLATPAKGQVASQENRPPAFARALTLAQALARVVERNPELTVSQLEIEAAAYRILQAGLKPNPEFVAEAENFAAMGGSGLFRYTESTLQMSQKIELGGKRDLRTRAAEQERGIASVELEARKARLLASASQAFADVLVGYQLLANQQELLRLSEQAHSTVGQRVAAGKVSPVEQTRAAVALATALLEEQRQGRALTAAKDRLAALWGGSHEDFDSVEAQFEIPPLTTGVADSCIENNPELRLAALNIDFRRATLELEQAYRKPDVTVSAGFRHLNLEDQPAWIASVAIPLPLFDKRQGAIAEARIRLNKSRSEKDAVAWRLRAGLAQAKHEHALALQETGALTRDVLPAAKEAVAALEEGYRLGKFDYLNVLDAQRTYAELQRRYIEAVASGIKAAIEIERLARCDAGPNTVRPPGERKEISYED